MTDDWWSAESGDATDSSITWRSSTAFHDWLAQHPELATELTMEERDDVRVGDLVQFDWDGSGDRDHTGVITKIETRNDGSLALYYAAHTDDTLMRSVDWATTVLHPGASATFWHLT